MNMKRAVSTFSWWLFLAVIALGTASCSSDDDNGAAPSMSAPKYERYSALYLVTDVQSDYTTVEFTASGNYLVTTRTETYFGTYTVTGDQYDLAGFGTVLVNGGASGTVSLQIQTNGGPSVTVAAQRRQQYSTTGKTDMLCRTWKLDMIWLYSKIPGQETVDRYFTNYREFLTAMHDMEGDEYTQHDLDVQQAWEPVNVIFTKSATYVVTYRDGTLSRCTWKWGNEGTGVVLYAWDYDSLDSPATSGEINVDFNDDARLLITDYSYIDYQNSANVAFVQYIMSEVK